MTAISDLSDLINLATGGNNGTPDNQWVFKVGRVGGAAATSPTAGRTTSLWQYEGSYGAGSAPTTGAIPTRSTNGAIPFVAPGGAREKWLIQVGASCSTPGVLILYDRLFHIGGLSGISTSDQTVQGSPASPALTRNTGGEGNFAFYEVYTAIGTTTRTLTMTYTDDAGNASQTSTVSIGGTGYRLAQTIQMIPLAAGDKGVRAVEKVKLDASTGTAGDFGITIARPIAYIPINGAGILGIRDYTTGLPGIPSIDSNACLSWMWLAATTTAPEIFGCCSFVEK